jgi:large subunit ribosomal protein L21
MFAVIRTGGKQYRVAPNDIIKVERLAGEPGEIVELGEVLLLGGGDGAPQTGKPMIAGAVVAAEVLDHTRGDKILVFKKKRRKNYRRTKGHRQALTLLRITEILTDGKKPSKVVKAEPKKAPAKKAEPKKPEAKTAAKAPPKKAPGKKPAAKKAEAKARSKKPAAKAPPKKAPANKPAAKPKAKK